MTRYVLHIRNNEGHGRHYQSGGYLNAGYTLEAAQTRARGVVADYVTEGWHVSKRRQDASQTWLTKRERGLLHRVLIEIEEQPCQG